MDMIAVALLAIREPVIGIHAVNQQVTIANVNLLTQVFEPGIALACSTSTYQARGLGVYSPL
jgi:hypothetical protein